MDKDLVLTEMLSPSDEIDERILSDVLLLVQNTNTIELIKYWISQTTKVEKGEERFLMLIGRVGIALYKVNAHRRNYHRIKAQIVEKLSSDPNNSKTNIDILFNKQDAFVEIEGFFTKYKTTLDLLAQSLKPIYGVSHHTWSSGKKDGYRGKEIVNSLNNLSQTVKPHTLDLQELIIRSATILDRQVFLRDQFVHYEEMKEFQGFRYSVKNKLVYPPIVLINQHESAFVHEYMDEQMDYLLNFSTEFLVTILSNLIGGMYPEQDKDGIWGWYSKTIRK